MSTISVPLTPDLEGFIERMIKQGIAPTKAEVVRQALNRYEEDQAVEAVLRSMRDVKEGKVFSGDLDELAKQLR